MYMYIYIHIYDITITDIVWCMVYKSAAATAAAVAALSSGAVWPLHEQRNTALTLSLTQAHTILYK